MLKFNDFISEAHRGVDNYLISFDFKGQNYEIVSSTMRDLFCDVVDWLYERGYDFSNLTFSIDEMNSKIKTTTYRLGHFHNISNSGNVIQIHINNTKLPQYLVSRMEQFLKNFGAENVKFEGFDIYQKSKNLEDDDLVSIEDVNTDLEAELHGEEIIEDETPALLKLRSEFWAMFLPEINKVTDKYKNRTRGKDQWFNVSSPIRGINYGCTITSKYIKVHMDIFREKEENKIIFDLLYNKKEQIESEFGDTLTWERKDDKRISIICYKKSPINAYDKSNWPEIMNFFLEYFPKFEKTFDRYLEKIDDIKGFSDLYPRKEETKISPESYEVNPFMQAVCILGKSGRGKSTTIDNMLEKYPNMKGQFIIPTASTTGLLAQFSPTGGREGRGGYIPSRLGKMIMDAHNNPTTLYTAVFDECHKASIIEMINDELLQCISTKRNKGNRFISLDTETESLFSGLADYRGNLLLPDNFGFIFLSSKPDVITSNADFFNRVNIYVLKKVDYKTINYDDMIKETGVDLNGKPTYELTEDYFYFIPGKSKEDIQQIEKLNDEE